MGKGDKRSRKSKIWRGTHGKTRPTNKKKYAKENRHHASAGKKGATTAS